MRMRRLLFFYGIRPVPICIRPAMLRLTRVTYAD